MQPLATLADYELLIGPVDPSDEPRLDYLLLVASTVVTTVAPDLYSWLSGVNTAPVPEPAVLVTCQVGARLLEQPTGSDGAVSMERIGWVQTAYTTSWSQASGLLPAGWQLMLKPWRPPDLASIRLSVPHPSEALLGGYGQDWWWPWDAVVDQ